MNAWPEHRRPPLQALLARAAAWLVAPPAAAEPSPWDPPGQPGAPARGARPPAGGQPGANLGGSALDPPRPLVAVLGLGPRAGASTVARAVAVRLAAFDPGRAAVLHTADPPRGAPATADASRLARALAAGGHDRPRAAGRLCVVAAAEPLARLAAPRPAPVVADLAHGEPADGPVALADHVVVVAGVDAEPALVAAVAVSLRETGVSASTVLNRVSGDPPSDLAHALVVPESRLAAQLTLACREPRGPLAQVAGELAERSLAEVWR